MAERIVPVTQVRVHMDCGAGDCTGEMLNNGEAFLTSPPRYPHYCNVCARMEIYRKRYPCLDFREVNDGGN